MLTAIKQNLADYLSVHHTSPFLGAASLDADGDFRHLAETLEGQIKERTAELQASEARLRTIFETSYQYQGLLALDGTLLDANAASLSGIEAALNDVAGKAFWDTPWFTGTPGMPEAVRAAIEHVAAGGSFRQEITLDLPAGERIFDFSLRPIRDGSGTLFAIVSEALELTEQRKAQQELREHRDTLQQRVDEQTKVLKAAKEQAEAANIAKTEFLANMSHEIRTPMNAVLGLTNILGMSEPLTQKQREFIKTLQLSADSLLSLINDLLDISKIEARTIELEHIPFCLTQLTQEVISMMSVRLKEKGLTFTTDAEYAKHHEFLGDPMRVRQIILNLCSNAIKFTQTGGIHIAITSEATDNPEVKNVRIAVKDTGIGIPADRLEDIFNNFVQADSTISRKYGGTGLGLAITKTLVHLMQGTINVESAVGEGSIFTVCLPLPLSKQTLQNALTAVPAMAAAEEAAQHPRVLLVEDYAANVLVATTFLELFGYSYDLAQNGMEAIEKVKSGEYVAVLMDVQMYGINGFETTQLIRKYETDSGKPRLHIIGMTAHALAGDRERCLASGMDDYISKPFNPDALSRKLAVVKEKMA